MQDLITKKKISAIVVCLILGILILVTTNNAGYKSNNILHPETITTSKYEPVFITEHGEKYHRIDCRYLFNSCEQISVERAKSKGYEPCSVCKPPQ